MLNDKSAIEDCGEAEGVEGDAEFDDTVAVIVVCDVAVSEYEYESESEFREIQISVKFVVFSCLVLF
ncbi:uncharacterized protein MONOS_9161 [Monocercomonoides exilis]|uniref:uncharacterized protein n=1 Tax=Monocercomonoides exilis TaxID=2049356 RepID=UPI00355939A8|nr:hypothetical protein MONOS_9161 [Monocercomonoides exilis]|eukprot:MONOS_9161.1-p1 / transcript=MONOS_9161.1 / gene=MONOS_9161 / organism=Monocercomonoides_exilis_PA203 / gene_product=unspecified product / transcript_product=unspecified product / location=Mono_scaffold00369:29904-30104(+) / protein_length=67 / sequence_SO=supercontig / SO=protein_coding / is_pseudo=false